MMHQKTLMICLVNCDYSSSVMRKIFFILLLSLISICVNAQDEAESVVFSDIEVDGFENLWIQSSLKSADEGVVYDELARPKCGKTHFMFSVQKTMQKLFRAISKKYPDELLAMYGTNSTVLIVFIVKEDGSAVLQSITNGTSFGIDAIIAQKLVNSCKKWEPALLKDEKIQSKMMLKIDISI